MKNQQWQLGPETLIVSRNKKEGNRGYGSVSQERREEGKEIRKKEVGRQKKDEASN